MKVTFLRDFRGRATAEVFYTAGTTVDLPDWQARMCLAEGAVEFVVSVPEVPAVETPVAVPSSTATGATARKTATKRAAKKAAK